MTPVEDNDLEREGDDMLAAEYVLGVLTMDERAAAGRRIDDDRAFAQLVEAWQVRLAPLDDDFAPVDPPASVKSALDARLFGTPAPSDIAGARGGLLQSLAFWRGLAGAAVLAALLAVFLPPMLRAPAPTETEPRLVASLVSDQSEVRYLMTFDPETGQIGLTQVSGDREAGTEFQLWTITTPGQSPVSVGLIPPGTNVSLPVVGAERDRIGSGAHFAISIEPPGGSPTGQPTGPVIAAGDLYGI